MKKVLVVATSSKTRGGITSVVKAHRRGAQWKEWHCRWIETHCDKGFLWKLLYLVRGWLEFVILLPFYEIVHFHLSEPFSAIRKCLFFSLAKILGKKTIVHFHAFSPKTTIDSRYRCIYRYLFTGADKIVVLSIFWKKVVEDAFGKGLDIQVIYNPCMLSVNEIVINEDSDKVFSLHNITIPKHNIILYAGTINARKGYADMIKAFARIADNHRDWIIVFAGNGEVEQGKKIADELGIGEQTIFLGWVSGTEKKCIFSLASVFCLPSYAEGFPMAVLDAISYGLPVITTPVGGIPDVAEDGKNMLLFHPGDVEKLAQTMEHIIDDKVLRNKLSEEARNLSQTIFNIDTINNEIADLYKQLSN